MKLLVTGASGFLGGFVLEEAASAGHEVLALVRSNASAIEVQRRGAIPLPGDLDNPSSVDEAFSRGVKDGAQALVNLASLGFGHAPAIVDAAQEAGLSRAVFVSTTAVTTALPAPSKRMRLLAERCIRDSSLDWTIVRPTMIYGAAGDRNIARLLAALRRSPVLPVPGGGTRLQQPTHVQDLAQVLLSAVVADGCKGNTYDVAGPEPLTFRQLLADCAAAVHARPLLIPVPLLPSIWALKLYERVARHPRLKAEQLERLAEDKVYDIRTAIRDLGYQPRSFRQGVVEEAASLWG